MQSRHLLCSRPFQKCGIYLRSERNQLAHCISLKNIFKYYFKAYWIFLNFYLTFFWSSVKRLLLCLLTLPEHTQQFKCSLCWAASYVTKYSSTALPAACLGASAFQKWTASCTLATCQLQSKEIWETEIRLQGILKAVRLPARLSRQTHSTVTRDVCAINAECNKCATAA